jgi:hypothetical protein
VRYAQAAATNGAQSETTLSEDSLSEDVVLMPE